MTSWDDLVDELDRWQSLSRIAEIWLRDDDAADVTPALDRLAGLGRRYSVPLSVAAIPVRMTNALARYDGWPGGTRVLQHGYAHTNHAPAQAKKSEFGTTRTLAAMATEIAAGWERLASLSDAIPVFVPPWNRMTNDLAERLPALGLRGLSTFGPRPTERRPAGLHRSNAHVDIIQWHGTRGFVGVENALAQLIGHLEARRHHAVDTDEATGILSHHAVHDEDCWLFLEQLFDIIGDHPASRWASGEEIFRL